MLCCTAAMLEETRVEFMRTHTYMHEVAENYPGPSNYKASMEHTCEHNLLEHNAVRITATHRARGHQLRGPTPGAGLHTHTCTSNEKRMVGY